MTPQEAAEFVERVKQRREADKRDVRFEARVTGWAFLIALFGTLWYLGWIYLLTVGGGVILIAAIDWWRCAKLAQALAEERAGHRRDGAAAGGPSAAEGSGSPVPVFFSPWQLPPPPIPPSPAAPQPPPQAERTPPPP